MTQPQHATLLVELLTEELPPKALARLGDAFAEGIAQRLAARDLIDGAPSFERYATPRRLAVTIHNVRAVAPEKHVREKVLPVSVALDKDGEPTAPLAKKLATLGFPDFSVNDLERAQDGKAEAFFLRYAAPGATLADGLQDALNETIAKLPIPKPMTYQRPDGSSVQFVRPAHRLIALHGEEIVPVGVLGIDADDTTLGHRFLSEGFVQIQHAQSYAETLEHRGRVIASFAKRKEAIRSQLLAKAGADKVVMPEALLDEVTSLVEWPVVYECRFEDEFLQVPQECLILTMQTNQKYFALTDANGKLRSRFLIVSNIETETPVEIIEGNERVVRPRLADAKFFFTQDKKKPLAERVPLLANVVYHNKLGSALQRVERLEGLAGAIAALTGADVALAKRAARLAKADLITDMVGEFPELQGTMGTYYARHDGEPEEVALACSEHYQPRFSGDALPTIADSTDAIYEFSMDRLRGLLRERGYAAGEIDAVLALNPTRLDDIVARLDAVREFASLAEAASLAAANKRISNILKKSEGATNGGVQPALLTEAAEQALNAQLQQVTPRVQSQLAARDYTGALTALAALREPVDTFFNDVMVNAEDPALRANRLALLGALHQQMNCVADISRLAA
jgi:glycyl-tRNA synthetase beta chain